MFDYAGSAEYSLIDNYVYVNGEKIAKFETDDYWSRVHYYLSGHLGSAGAVVWPDGYMLVHNLYRPWGEKLHSERASGDNRFCYTGQLLDEDLSRELYYYGARYYDPMLKIFTSVDPLWDKYPGWGSYVYCLNNPIKLRDPDGRVPTKSQLSSAAEAAKHFRLDGRAGVHYRDHEGDAWQHRYVALRSGVIVDMLHFTAAAEMTVAASGYPGGRFSGFAASQLGGLALEFKQAFFSDKIGDNASAFSPEDMASNLLGGVFGFFYASLDGDLQAQLLRFFRDYGGITPEMFKEVFPDIYNSLPRTESDALDDFEAEGGGSTNSQELKENKDDTDPYFGRMFRDVDED